MISNRTSRRSTVCLIGGVLAVLANLGVAGFHGQNSDEDPYRAARLVTRWTIVINEQFERSKVVPSEESLLLLDELMSVGAVRAVRDHMGERQLKGADADMARFVIAMAKAGARQPDGSVQLDEASFGEALRTLCPLYPFCEAA